MLQITCTWLLIIRMCELLSKSTSFDSLQVWSIHVFVNTMQQSSHEWPSQQIHPKVRLQDCRDTIKSKELHCRLFRAPLAMLNIKVNDSTIRKIMKPLISKKSMVAQVKNNAQRLFWQKPQRIRTNTFYQLSSMVTECWWFGLVLQSLDLGSLQLLSQPWTL